MISGDPGKRILWSLVILAQGSGTSAQQAELKALIEACKLASGRSANIYTDSWHGFGVSHDFGQLWRQRRLMTAARTPIKKGLLVLELFESLWLTVPVLEVKTDTRDHTSQTEGKALTDSTKQSARGWDEDPEVQLRKLAWEKQLISYKQMEKRAWREKVWTWMETGAKLH